MAAIVVQEVVHQATKEMRLGFDHDRSKAEQRPQCQQEGEGLL